MHGLVGNFEAGAIAGEFGDRSFVFGGQRVGGIGGDAIKQKLRAFDLDRHLGEFPLDALELAQCLPELAAGLGVLAGDVKGMTPDGERTRRVADALDVEPGYLLLETASAQQDVFRRNEAIFEIKLLPAVAAHEMRLLTEREARRVALQND